jgi:hypothetical protein
MSTPNPTASSPSPALVAASPYLKQALTDLKAALTTILTGDPMLIPARATPAVAILLNQLALLEPGVLVAEEGVVAQSALGGIDKLIAKLP